MFKSFYMAGFECATGKNRHGEPLDQIAATEHDVRADEDYARLADLGIYTVREASRWALVDRGSRYEFDALVPFVRAARHQRMEIIWDLFHYGYPEDVDLFSDGFVERFARYAAATARYVCRELKGPYYFTPVNEPSYFAWAAGDVAHFAPHERGRGHELKQRLVLAQIAAVKAIRAVCPAARFVTVDPVCHVVAPHDATLDQQVRVRQFNHDVVFQFLDMCSGRTAPELGGHPSFVDIIGINYYANNQWELDRPDVPLALDDPRRVSLAALCRQVERRYDRPFLISETAAGGADRAPWIADLQRTTRALLRGGSEISGICLYPILGMPEWHDQRSWAQLGLWELDAGSGSLERLPHFAGLRALQEAQADYERLVAARRLPRASYG